MIRAQQMTRPVEQSGPSRPVARQPAPHTLLQLQRTAGNAAVSALLTRTDGSVVLQREPAPADDILATRGPQGLARDGVNNALLIASNWLAVAIANRDNDAPLPDHVFRAYSRFFRGSSLDRLDVLKTRVDDALTWAAGIPFDVIPNPVPAGYRDERVHRAGLALRALLAAAMQPPASADVYVALYPPWFTASSNMRMSVLLHELFHLFPSVAHPPGGGAVEPAWQNARAYQGFITTVAGLPELPGITAMFPP